MRVFVTGGSGFLGRHTVPLLRDAGHEVAALARRSGAAGVLEEAGARAVAGDLDDATSFRAAITSSRPDALVNLASLGFGHAPTIVAGAEAAGLGRAVFISTTAIFTTLEARSKAVRLAAEHTVRRSSLDWTVLRPTMIFGGPDDRNMARLLRLLRVAPLVPLPAGGRALQQPIHVDDLAAAVVAALDRPATVGRAYNLAGPEPLPLSRVVSEAAAALGRSPRLVPFPLGPARAVVGTYERLVARPRLRAEQVERLGEDKAVDISDARHDLGFAPRPFAAAIRAQAAAR
ncbi:MAG: NAD-dependent epimerase/dehydratase family protein [Acidimicrobiales bacterium]